MCNVFVSTTVMGLSKVQIRTTFRAKSTKNVFINANFFSNFSVVKKHEVENFLVESVHFIVLGIKGTGL